jgi:hypothetical protein
VKEQRVLQLERSCSKRQHASESECAAGPICFGGQHLEGSDDRLCRDHLSGTGGAATESRSLNPSPRIITITSSCFSRFNFHKADAFVSLFSIATTD